MLDTMSLWVLRCVCTPSSSCWFWALFMVEWHQVCMSEKRPKCGCCLCPLCKSSSGFPFCIFKVPYPRMETSSLWHWPRPLNSQLEGVISPNVPPALRAQKLCLLLANTNIGEDKITAQEASSPDRDNPEYNYWVKCCWWDSRDQQQNVEHRRDRAAA